MLAVNHGLQFSKYITVIAKQWRYNLEEENNLRYHKNTYHNLDFIARRD
jgi:hypothetical protein